jgi:hypothetical protein
MKEIIIIRLHNHAVKDGVPAYTFEFEIPGIFQQTNIGASQEELTQPIHDGIMQMLSLLGIPKTVKRIPASEFAVKSTASFNAQIIRDGKVVED